MSGPFEGKEERGISHITVWKRLVCVGLAKKKMCLLSLHGWSLNRRHCIIPRFSPLPLCLILTPSSLIVSDEEEKKKVFWLSRCLPLRCLKRQWFWFDVANGVGVTWTREERFEFFFNRIKTLVMSWSASSFLQLPDGVFEMSLNVNDGCAHQYQHSVHSNEEQWPLRYTLSPYLSCKFPNDSARLCAGGRRVQQRIHPPRNALRPSGGRDLHGRQRTQRRQPQILLEGECSARKHTTAHTFPQNPEGPLPVTSHTSKVSQWNRKPLGLLFSVRVRGKGTGMWCHRHTNSLSHRGSCKRMYARTLRTITTGN